MKKRTMKKVISIVLSLGMIFTTMYAPVGLAYAEEEGPVNSVWTKLDDIAAAAASEKTVAITMTLADGTVYVLPTAEATSAGPAATKATLRDGVLVASEGMKSFGWTIAKETEEGNTYTIVNGDGKYLYVINNNNGVRVGDKPETGFSFTVAEDGYLTGSDGTNSRKVGVYKSTPNWRCYTSVNDNIKDQTLNFWEFDSEEAGQELKLVPISEALAAETGDQLKVKGVVTLVDGKNIYIQDETGGICLFFDAAPTDIVLGDTLIGTGLRATYNGLPEISKATYEKSEGMTLTAKETTLGALTTADVCTYVTIKDLTVDSINGSNTNVKDAEGKTLPIYKAVLGDKTLAVGDTLDFTGAVGIYKTDLQLRNTKADEITIKEAPIPEGPFTVTVEEAVNGTITASKTAEIEAGEEITITVAPAEGYVLDRLLVNGEAVAVGEDGTATVKITQDTTVSATFKEKGEPIPYEAIDAAKNVYELTDVLADGDRVLIYNAGSKNAITSTIKANYYLEGMSYTSETITEGTVIGAFPIDAEATEWTVKANEDGTYTFTQGEKTLAGKQVVTDTRTNNNLTLSAEDSAAWKLSVCNAETKSFYISNPALTSRYADEGGALYLEWYANQTEFSLYDTSRISEPNFGFTFYKLVRTAEEGITYTVTAEEATNGSVAVSKAEVEPGEEITITVTPAEGYELEALLVNGEETAVDENGKATVKVTGNTTVKATFKEKQQEVPATTWAKLTEAPADGSQIIIYYPASNLALTSTVSGKKLAGAAGEVSGDSLTVTDEMAKLNVAVADGVYTFTNEEGKYLTSGATGNSLSFEDAESDYSKWTLEQQTDGTWYVVNANAVYNSNKQALEYYSGFTTFSYKADNSAYKFDFYGPSNEGLVTDLADLKDGSYVVIYNEANKLAMTSETYNDWYIMPAATTIEDGKVKDPAPNTVWKVGVNEDGSYTFTQGDKAVSAWLDGTYVELTTNPSYNDATAKGWTLTQANAEKGLFYMASSTLTTSYGNVYAEVYGKKVNNVSGTLVFCGYSTSADKLTEGPYGMQFYIVPEPVVEETGDMITDLSQLTDGATVAIYSPSHQTAVSSKPNGDWYLKANSTTIENGKVASLTSDMVWKVKVNEDGTYKFISNDNPENSIAVWPSGNYAELTVNTTYNDQTVNDWLVLPFNEGAHTWYIKSSTLTLNKNNADLPVYIEAYVRNDAEVFSGFAPTANQLTGADFALQFYAVSEEDILPSYDDGEWDGVLNKGDQYVIYNANAGASLGLYKAANYAFDAIETTIEGDVADPGNGAYVFTVDTMGRYYTFQIGDQYLATNPAEELLFVGANEDGTIPDEAKWYLKDKGDGYIIYNKECTYGGTPVCIEYFSSVFSGWTFSPKNDLAIYLFNFYKVKDGVDVYENVVQKPSVKFDCADVRYVEQDFVANYTLFDLAPEAAPVSATYTIGDKTEQVPKLSFTGANGALEIPAEVLDANGLIESFDISITVKNSYDLEYSATKTIKVLDEPFFGAVSPAPNSQTKDDFRPVISAEIGNVGENPTFKMTINGQEVEATYKDGVLSYQSDEDMAEGRATVAITVTREDGVSAEKQWSFNVGLSAYQMYFGQLHSHTTYSDGSGELDTALDYVANLPESANVQFVAFTDHSNYFDTTSAANPADALNDASLMTPASKALWDEYKGKVAAFNEAHTDKVAIGGFEMTWSGGPGHINTFDSDGLVSRNNADLNNKSDDAGMKLYYKTINKGDSLNQFNHPGTTFGNFTDFSYWDEETDNHMFLVEVGNGEGQIGAGGYYPSYEEYFLALDKGWHVAPTNNQDNHKGRWGNANDARDVVFTDDFSEQGIYDAIRNLRVYATEDKNLHINYTVNDEPMGTIFSEVPESLLVRVNTYDPDESDEIAKVEVVVDGGKTIQTWDEPYLLESGDFAMYFDPAYTYYLIRVTQKDGDIAVTAPVWTGMSTKVGITSLKAEDEKVYKDEETKLVTTFFNNEAKDATVKSLTFTTMGGQVLGTDTEAKTIKANGTLEAEYPCTFDKAKHTTVTVTAVIEYDGKEVTSTAKVELDVLDKDTEGKITPIADVIKASVPNDTGYIFTIEGTLTSNASGYDKDTAFFDCVYVQDETAGICIFPVSGDYKVGDKVRVYGYTDFYQGEPELQVKTIEVIGSDTVAPTEVTAAQINDRSVEGSLVTLKGTIESFEEANGLIQTIMVKDAAGDVARVFIDGYITTGHEVENCAVGAEITATGLASYDDTFNAPEGPFPRIRVRDRADVVCKASDEPPIAHKHTYGAYKLTRKATTKQSGLLTKTCKECGKKVTMKVNPVVAKAVVKTKTSAKISWKKVKGAQRYQVYFAKTGKTFKKVKTTKNLYFTKKKLTKGAKYKFKVVAQRKISGKWKTISTGYTGYFVANNLSKDKKYTNVKSISVKKDAVTLKVGKTSTIKATVKKVKASKKLLPKSYCAKLRYLSTNTAVAKVSTTGKITAKKKGTCYVYVLGKNGVWKSIKVTVK